MMLRGLRARAASWLMRGLTTYPFGEGPGWSTLNTGNGGGDLWTGSWQQDVHIEDHNALRAAAVHSCTSLIANDIAKMRPKLLQLQGNGIWQETANAAYSPVLREPNHFQSWDQFHAYWVLCRLLRGNVYALKERDARGVVVGLVVLHPDRVTTLIAETGDVFYCLQRDLLAGIEDSVTVPASEVIHDVVTPVFHPLIGVSPIYAAGLAARISIHAQRNSSRLFGNMSRPSGILTGPGLINTETATRLKTTWEQNYGGENIGKVAVLGDDLKFMPMTVSAADSQLIEQLKWADTTICSVYHVPPFMIGIAEPPAQTSVESLWQIYFQSALQVHAEAIERRLTRGLGMAAGLRVELDTRALLRMDTAARFEAWSLAVKGGWMTPNEARQEENLPPVDGGDSPYMQQQNYSLAALAARDRAGPAPSSLSTPAPADGTTQARMRPSIAAPEGPMTEAQLRAFSAEMRERQVGTLRRAVAPPSRPE